MIRILLVDDHPILRKGVIALFEQEKDLQVVGEVSSGINVLESVDSLKPDLVILDLSLPEINGIEITRQLRKDHPGTRILMLSMFTNNAYVRQALSNGAHGYVVKSTCASVLITAIREVMAGRLYLSPPLDESVILDYETPKNDSSMDLYEKLTPREREVLSLAAQGLTNAVIGKRLFISPRTVEVHRSNIIRKLCLRSHSELLRFAISRGILLTDLPSTPSPDSNS
jgi:two-component system, NarL family, response regulator NreC